MPDNQQAKFRVWWDEENRIIRCEAWGNFEEEDAKAQAEEFKKMLEARPGKTSVVNDLRKAGTASSGARKVFVQTLKDEKFEKTAFIGLKVVTRTIISFLIKFAGVNNVRCFDNEEDALRWIKGS